MLNSDMVAVLKQATTEAVKLSDLKSKYRELTSSVQEKQTVVLQFKSLFEKEEEIKNAFREKNAIKSILSSHEKSLVFLEKDLSKESISLVLDVKSQKFWLYVLEKLTSTYVDKLESSLNDIYTYVFQQNDKKVRLSMEDRYNKKVLILKMVNVVNGEEMEEPLEESGFSVATVLGTILLVYYIQYNNYPKVIFFDESFGGLDDMNLPRFMEMLKMFVEELGFQFCIVSHDKRLVKFSDNIYYVKDGVYTKQSKSELGEEVDE